jgi:hypothetical protein
MFNSQPGQKINPFSKVSRHCGMHTASCSLVTVWGGSVFLRDGGMKLSTHPISCLVRCALWHSQNFNFTHLVSCCKERAWKLCTNHPENITVFSYGGSHDKRVVFLKKIWSNLVLQGWEDGGSVRCPTRGRPKSWVYQQSMWEYIKENGYIVSWPRCFQREEIGKIIMIYFNFPDLMYGIIVTHWFVVEKSLS